MEEAKTRGALARHRGPIIVALVVCSTFIAFSFARHLLLREWIAAATSGLMVAFGAVGIATAKRAR